MEIDGHGKPMRLLRKVRLCACVCVCARARAPADGTGHQYDKKSTTFTVFVGGDGAAPTDVAHCGGVRKNGGFPQLHGCPADL
jgi:hypothetical protein